MTEFTIKHMTDDGDTHYWSASHISAIPNKHPDRACQTIHLYSVNGEDVTGTIDGGIVYVINKFGKTVDRIDLNTAPPSVN